MTTSSVKEAFETYVKLGTVRDKKSQVKAESAYHYFSHWLTPEERLAIGKLRTLVLDSYEDPAMFYGACDRIRARVGL